MVNPTANPPAGNLAAAPSPIARFVVREGLRLHHLDWGGSAPETLVLLHGIRLHAQVWNDFARRAHPHFRVLALDARGHGESGWHPEAHYHLEDHVADLLAVISAQARPPVTLLGHSLGGRIAMLFAARHPEWVRRLVLVDMGAGLPTTLGQKDFSRMTQSPPPQDFASPEETAAYLGRILHRAPAPLIEETAVHGLRETGTGRYIWKYDPALRSRPAFPGRTAARHPDVDLWAAVAGVQCPTLLLHGALSEVVTPEIVQRMLDTMPNCRAERIDAAGHALFTEQPDAFARAVAGFLGMPSRNPAP